MARQRARKSPMSQGAGGRSLEKSVARPRVWMLVLLLLNGLALLVTWRLFKWLEPQFAERV